MQSFRRPCARFRRHGKVIEQRVRARPNRRDVDVSHKCDMEYVCCMYGSCASALRLSCVCPPERAPENIVFQSHYCIMSWEKLDVRCQFSSSSSSSRRMLCSCVCVHPLPGFLAYSIDWQLNSGMAPLRAECVRNEDKLSSYVCGVLPAAVPWTNWLCVARLHRQESSVRATNPYAQHG